LFSFSSVDAVRLHGLTCIEKENWNRAGKAFNEKFI